MIMKNRISVSEVAEGSLGNMVKESSIPFDIPRKLTEEELQETVKYCRHDVEQTVEVFMTFQS